MNTSVILGCLVFWASSLRAVHAFTFSIDSQPTECGSLSVSWTGGQPPFRLLVVTPLFAGLNISIDDSSFKDGKGSFNIPSFAVAGSSDIFFSMSDASGPVSGGTSGVMTVGSASAGQTCNTTLPANDFFFSASSELVQCSDFSFIRYEGAVKPLTIFAFIPGGSDSFVLPFSPIDADAFTWKANISAQTEVAFWTIDSQNRRGGIDKLRTVGSSSDTSCLVPKAASTSTSSSGSGTGTSTSTSSRPGITQPSEGETDRTGDKKGLSTGDVVAIAIGIGVALPALLGLLWYMRRQRRSSQDVPYPPYSPSSPHKSPTSPYPLPLQSPPMQYVAEPFNPPGGVYSQNPHNSDPFGASPSQSYPRSPGTSYYGYNPGGGAPSTPSAVGGSTSGGRPQDAVHQDAAEGMTNSPPQSVDRRGPVTMSYPGNIRPFPHQGGDTKTG
ncbi:hypothetical protein PM082_018312 [Marasmius tenuissimus]|nr:hypothetical protein PM082_018312 [Marasmius tenuissimus]